MHLARTICILASLAALCASADDKLPLFDSHVHYSFNAVESYPPPVVLKWLDQAVIRRAILSSTPNDGTIKLHTLYPDRFIPFLRPYRKAHDSASWATERQSWYRDPETLMFIETELARGIYRGIGEFHVNGDEVDTPVMRGIVEIAVKRNIWLMAHSDASAIEKLFAFNPKVKVIWAHTGMTEPEQTVGRVFANYPTLIGELSYRSGIAGAGGIPSPWRELFLRYADRFVYGSDTWVASRWPEVPSLAEAARGWLADLPKDVAEKIAFGNGERLFARRGQ